MSPVRLVVGALIVTAAGVILASQLLRRAESTPAINGEAVALKYGCFSCHGPEGRGGVPDPSTRNGMIPGWDGQTVAALAEDEDEVVEWILDGVPERLRKLESHQDEKPLVPMPGYRGLLSDRELSEFLAYFRAVSGFGTDMPEPAYEGWRVAGKLGCYGCHGPGGIGGCPNPGSFKGHIPAWDGEEYAELVRNEDEFREWTLTGRTERLWGNPLARHFLEKQTIQMPAYEKHVSEDELDKMVAYVRWLRRDK